MSVWIERILCRWSQNPYTL